MKVLTAYWKKFAHSELETIPSILSTKYLPSLDGLRAVSIALVIIGHVFYSANKIPWYDNGHTGVQIFFVISGFLITTLLLKERINNGQISLKNFYIRRVLRIFPVAYLYLLVLIILNLVFLLHITFASFATAFLYLKNFTLLDAFDFLKASEWQTGHYWSLSVEEQFYLIFPFLLVYNFKLYIRLIVFLILFIPFANILYYHGPAFLSIHWIHLILRTVVDGLGTGTTAILWGSLCSILLFKGLIPISFFEKYKWTGIFLLVFLLFVNARNLIDFPGKEVLDLYLFAPGICLVILFLIQPGRYLGFTLLNNPVMRKIGVLSYSIYIWQQIFTHYQPWAGTFPHADAAWVNLPILAVVAYLSYYGFEKRFLALKNRFNS